MNTVLIDGDILIYKTPKTCQNEVEMKSEDSADTLYRTIYWGSKKGITGFLDKKIKRIKELTKCNAAIVCLSSKQNFRKTLCADYKSNRKTLKPVVYEFVRDYLKENYKALERENLEADDLIGIIATYKGKLKNIPEGKKVIWSMDKDFCTIPGAFCKESKSGVKRLETTEQEADYYWLFQTLIGDPTDGYKGCPNIGATRARKILGKVEDFELETAWMKVVNAFKEAGLNQKEAILQARLARILRADDYDFKTKELKLWEHL